MEARYPPPMRAINLYKSLIQIPKAHLNENYQIAGKLKGVIFRLVSGKAVVQPRPDYRQLKQSKGTKKCPLVFGRASVTTKKLNTGEQELVQGCHRFGYVYPFNF